MSATSTGPRYYETSDIARHFGVSAAAVQKWAKLGLVTPRRTVRGVALYSADDIRRIKELRAAREAARAARQGAA